ncbi:peptidylprolyl isomerase [Streptomyces sp. NPDC101132]|uniref:peptidylprolyl isomerase n=1 Tax=Streptomyces sp. NPDC101132 TaxID=3366110 RepID=UPI00382DE017
MVTSEQRRKNAREKFERQQQRRVEAQRKARRKGAVIGSAVAVVIAAVVATVASGAFSSEDDATPEAQPSPTATPSATQEAKKEPAMAVDRKAKYTFALKTNQGDLAITMDAAKTPRTVNSFKSLADAAYFDGTKCHRLTTGGIFVLQCGDPQGTGSGGPGYTIPDENLDGLGKAGADGTVTYPAGTVAMANTGQPGSGGSQFFLVYKDSKLPPTYTPFGKLDAAGLKAVEEVAKAGVAGGATDGAPQKGVTIEKATVTKG